jgi:hypothetical protein
VAEREDLNKAWRDANFYDWTAWGTPEASPPTAFRRAGIDIPTGDVSSGPSQNVEDRTQPYIPKSVPKVDPFNFNSDLARALGINSSLLSAVKPVATAAMGPVRSEATMANNTVGDAIDAAAAQYGLNPAVLKGIASIESSWDPGSNRNKSTQYKGLFQIGKDEWKQYGGNGDIYNAGDNANAAAKMLSDHAQWFNDNYGRQPTPGELYMMHLQGRGFIKNGTMTNVAGNPYPGMRGEQTPQSFQQGWSDTLARRMAPFGGADTIGDVGQAVAKAPPAFGPAAGAAAPQDLSGAVPSGLLGSMASAVPPGGAAPAPTPPSAGAVAAMSAPAPSDAAAAAKVTKLLADQKASEQSATSKGMMALAQQLLTASQAPKVAPMQLASVDTGPLHPLPLTLPKFGQLS